MRYFVSSDITASFQTPIALALTSNRLPLSLESRSGIELFSGRDADVADNGEGHRFNTDTVNLRTQRIALSTAEYPQYL